MGKREQFNAFEKHFSNPEARINNEVANENKEQHAIKKPLNKRFCRIRKKPINFLLGTHDSGVNCTIFYRIKQVEPELNFGEFCTNHIPAPRRAGGNTRNQR